MAALNFYLWWSHVNDEDSDNSSPRIPDVIDDDGWEEMVDSLLENSPHDAELGKEMARDAVRITLGEMTDEEFHEKYHDAVLEEFGVDDRPTETEMTENDH